MNLGILSLTMPLAIAAPPMLPPPTPPASITFVKVLAPAGAKTTWYPGTEQAFGTNDGDSVGLRPGYRYRFELANVGDRKNETIYPSFEVRGSLIPRSSLNVADHPIPIVLTDEDISRILEGRFLSKVYFLEDPEQAVNPIVPGVPVEIGASNEGEAYKEARRRGRIMVVVRAGERLFTRAELAAENVPGTILLRGMKTNPVPSAPPCLPYAGIPFDPLLGPRSVGGQECLFDGGDSKRPLGIGRENKLYGLDASDTAIEYTTVKGKKVATSNRVCICIPRFAAMRSEMAASSHQGVRGPQVHVQTRSNNTLMTKLPPNSVERFEQPIGVVGRVRPSGTIGEAVAVAKDTFTGKPAAVSTLKGNRVVAQVQETEELTTFCDSLILQKRVDPPHPKQIGEIVTFYLRYYNPTNQPMTEVAVSDSLTGRLEYIEASAKSDRPATFTAVANEAGSLVLRWAIDGKLLPGQVGIISFKARIR
jgi:uncharacterized repeat protein (TIGR01451 family)